MGKILQTAGKVAKWIPPFNFIEYQANGMFKDRKKGRGEFFTTLKGFGHLTYAIIGTSTLMLCAGRSYSTGEINPIKARQIMVQRIEQTEAEKVNYQRQVSELSERLFGTNGLADTNRDKRRHRHRSDRSKIIYYSFKNGCLYPTGSTYHRCYLAFRSK